MVSLRPTIHRNIWFAILTALTILVAGLFLLHNISPGKKDLASTGFLFDIVITYPVIYYYLIIRPFKLKKWRIVMVLTCCCAVGYLILPAHQRGYIIQLRKLTALLELGALVYILSKIRKIRAVYKALQNDIADVGYNLGKSMTTILGDNAAIKFMASEFTVLRFGLFFWLKQHKQPIENRGFSIHKETGYTALFGVILFICFVEITAFHLVLLRYSHPAAIIVSVLSVYGTIFIVGDFSAILKNPVFILNNKLLLRTGLRWRALVSFDDIASIEKVKDSFKPGEYCFKGAVMKSSVNILFTFTDFVPIERIYRKPVIAKQIVMSIDNADEFIDRLAESRRLLK